MSDIKRTLLNYALCYEEAGCLDAAVMIRDLREAAATIQQLRDALMVSYDYINCGFNVPQDFLDEIKELSHYKSLADAKQDTGQ